MSSTKAHPQIFRQTKIKSRQTVRLSAKHMFREQPTPNADDKIINIDIAGKSVAETMQNYDNVAGGVDKKIRKNAVHAIEFFVGANSEFFEGLPDEKKLDYLKDSLMYIAKKHGAENVIAASIHLDEKTPHLTAIVMPVAIDKKGRKGLSAKAFYGGSKHKMREVQDDFHAKDAKKHGVGLGEVGSEAIHKPAKQMRNEMKKALAAAEKRETEATAILSKTRDHVKRLDGVETKVRSGFYENKIKGWKALEQKIVFDTPKPAWGDVEGTSPSGGGSDTLDAGDAIILRYFLEKPLLTGGKPTASHAKPGTSVPGFFRLCAAL